jgi:hypothetical protein
VSAVVGVIVYDEQDGGGTTTQIKRAPIGEWSQMHTVDVGDTDYSLAEVTHRTRDGQPMVVRYSREHGYAVSVHTGEPS